ncbi:variable surface lipoprotein [Metamycoplasma hominis]
MMKKYTKILLTLGAISTSIVAVPLVAAGCNDPKNKKNPNNNDQSQDGQIEFQEGLGLKIAKIAKDQENVKVDEFVKEAKSAKTLDQIKALFTKYKIAYDLSEIPDEAKYEVAPGTHGHADEGLVHLDIIQTVNEKQNNNRFEIKGFKKETVEDTVQLGGYKLSTKILDNKKDFSLQEIKKQIIDAQEKGFNSLLEKLKEFVNIEVDENNKTKQFEFNKEKIELISQSGQIVFKGISIIDISKKVNEVGYKTESKTDFIIQGLNKVE